MIRAGDQRGFTIIELMLASVFFTSILAMSVAIFVQVNRAQTRGYTVKTVQQEGRKALEDISRSLRVTAGASSITHNAAYGCMRVGSTRYLWNSTATTAKTLSDGSTFSLVKFSDGASCDGTAALPAGTASSLLSEETAVQTLTLTTIRSGETYRIRLVLSPAGEGVTESPPGTFRCTALRGADSAYCAIVDLNDVVTRRVQ